MKILSAETLKQKNLQKLCGQNLQKLWSLTGNKICKNSEGKIYQNSDGLIGKNSEPAKNYVGKICKKLGTSKKFWKNYIGR